MKTEYAERLWTKSENPSHGSVRIVQVLSTNGCVHKLANPLHGSVGIVQVQTIHSCLSVLLPPFAALSETCVSPDSNK